MFNFAFLTLIMISLMSLPEVSAYPVTHHAPPAERISSSTEDLHSRTAQAPLKESTSSINATGRPVYTLQDLYEGNTRFRQNIRVQEHEVAETPSFMFLGCADSRSSPDVIFNSPVGSTLTHTNIANLYKPKDSSTEAAIAHALDSHVQHIIVLGHYGCKGVEMAITKSSTASRTIKSWLEPISHLYSKSRRTEIVKLRDSRMPQRDKPNGVTTAPPANDAGFRALVEENVKHSVKELRTNSMLAKAYSKGIWSNQNEGVDVFVHGLVYDEATGEVHNLRVSFGPPGKPIPTIPFKAVAAAKNFHRNSDRPGISQGKTWDFSAHSH